MLAPGRHQRSWTAVVDGPEHLLRIEFRRGKVRRDTTAFRLEPVAVVAAGVEKDLAARLHRFRVSCERISRPGLVRRCGAENADRPANQQDKKNASYRHVD